MLSTLNAYIQQSEVEPINIHHDYYAMKIRQVTHDLVSMLNTTIPQSHLSITKSFGQTLDRLKIYDQILDKKKLDNENKLKHLEDEISVTREYSLLDSLVREQIENLTRQQNDFTRQQQLIIKTQMILNEAIEHLHQVLIPNLERDKNEKFLEQIKQKG